MLEVDDIDDADIVDSLLDAHPPPGFQVISVHTPVGEDQTQAISLCQTFSQVWRGKLPCTSRDFSSASQHLVAAVCFKLRRMQPCLISSLEVGFLNKTHFLWLLLEPALLGDSVNEI